MAHGLPSIGIAEVRLRIAPASPRHLGAGALLDKCHVTSCNHCVIKTFADRNTQELYATGRSRRFPPEIVRRPVRRLEYIDLAACLDDLKVPPSNRLHELARDRKGCFSISVNDQWRICFRFAGGDAFDVELTDCH